MPKSFDQLRPVGPPILSVFSFSGLCFQPPLPKVHEIWFALVQCIHGSQRSGQASVCRRAAVILLGVLGALGRQHLRGGGGLRAFLRGTVFELPLGCLVAFPTTFQPAPPEKNGHRPRKRRTVGRALFVQLLLGRRPKPQPAARCAASCVAPLVLREMGVKCSAPRGTNPTPPHPTPHRRIPPDVGQT